VLALLAMVVSLYSKVQIKGLVSTKVQSRMSEKFLALVVLCIQIPTPLGQN